MTPPDQNPEETQTPEEVQTPDNAKTDNPGSASTTGSNTKQGRDWRSAALSADHTMRSGVDRLRPAAHRVGQWIAPLLLRVWNWLAPLIERIQGSAAFQRAQEKMAPAGAWIRSHSGSGSHAAGQRHPRLRALQFGGAVAAVGVVALVIGTAGTGQNAVNKAAHVDPIQSDQGQEQAAEEPDDSYRSMPDSGPPASGIDVSNHNGDIDWKRVAGSGQQFAFVLASDGDDFTSKTFEQQYKGAKDAGMMAGAYHFGRPDSPAVAQADRLLQANKFSDDGKSLPPVLDLEVDPKGGSCYGLSPGQMHDWTKQFVDRIKDGTGKDAIIYASPSFWSKCTNNDKSFSNNPLWLASYGVDHPKVPGGWNDYDFWQYTEEGKVDGVDGPVDMNRFNGSAEKLHKLAEE